MARRGELQASTLETRDHAAGDGSRHRERALRARRRIARRHQAAPDQGQLVTGAPFRSSLARSLIYFLFAVPLIARGDFREFRALPVEEELRGRLARVAEVSFKEFPKLTADNLALSVIDLTKPENL